MASERKIREVIARATATCQPQLLLDAFRSMTQLLAPSAIYEPNNKPNWPSPELPVLIAEGALELSAPERSEDEAIMFRPQMQELADRCITLFLGSVKPPKNQALSRAYLAQATLLSRLAAGRKGDGLVDQTLKALDLIIKALEIATSDPRFITPPLPLLSPSPFVLSLSLPTCFPFFGSENNTGAHPPTLSDPVRLNPHPSLPINRADPRPHTQIHIPGLQRERLLLAGFEGSPAQGHLPAPAPYHAHRRRRR